MIVSAFTALSAATLTNIELWVAGCSAAISLYTGTKIPKNRRKK